MFSRNVFVQTYEFIELDTNLLSDVFSEFSNVMRLSSSAVVN